jgi:uncharacterized protein YjiS (DUF1127 family)
VARGRIELTTEQEALIQKMSTARKPLELIAKALKSEGVTMSPPTLCRRIAELQAGWSAARAAERRQMPKQSAPIRPSEPVAAPAEDASLEDCNATLRDLGIQKEEAKAEGNHTAYASLCRVHLQWRNKRDERLAELAPKEESEDMVELGKQVARRMIKSLQDATNHAGS